MPSESSFLPSLRNLLNEVPTPGQRLDQLVQPSIESIGLMFSSPPEIHVGKDGYECIKSPLNENQRRILQGIAHGTILKRCPPGNNYIVPKRASQSGVPFEEAPDFIVCLSPQGPLAEKFADFMPPNYATQYKAQGSSFQIYLHCNPKDARPTLPICFTIPFISADPADIALSLPGVSIARLLTQEQNVLVNANSFIENPLLGTDIQVIKVNLFVSIVIHLATDCVDRGPLISAFRFTGTRITAWISRSLWSVIMGS
ncbi:hypothetical protein ARMSODRAFT_716698 [Armillaria solidipes]|uniref:Uncharacterized protein n=1 Tax=Armillaria solidipes TaxID=1076256 RepID=A0A2H3C8L8_9AGAR|nr:hypothetical protein ARMSODRAFT_716698 [Armillaria solidipes]